MSEELFLLGDQTDQRGFEQCKARVSGRTVIDVGANEGGWTLSFLESGAARVIAVEPGPNLVSGMRRRFAGQPVTVLQLGLSDTPGKLSGVTFYNSWTIATPGSLTGRIAALSPGARAIEGPELFDVQLTTLDALADDLRVDDLAFVKIDVDGYEPHVLRGGTRVLRELRPDALIELSYLPHEMGESIGAFVAGIYNSGYTLATLRGQVASARQVLDHFPWQTSLDMLMVPVDRYPDWPALR